MSYYVRMDKMGHQDPLQAYKFREMEFETLVAALQWMKKGAGVKAAGWTLEFSGPLVDDVLGLEDALQKRLDSDNGHQYVNMALNEKSLDYGKCECYSFYVKKRS